MFRSTIEMDDEDTLSEYRRRVAPNPDSSKEINITKKLRNITNNMHKQAGRILMHNRKIESREHLTDYEKFSVKYISSMWQILNKLLNDEKYRVNTNITELEKYASLIESYARLVEHMIDYLDTLADARKKEVSQIEIVEQAHDFLIIVKEFLGELKEFHIQFKKFDN